MLDVRKLQVLRAVITNGSITAAAANLGYTPSAISQQVAALEKEAGVALLSRAGRGVAPTAAGKLLAEFTATITEQLTKAESALADLRAGRTGLLRVRYFATAGAALVPQAVASFRAEHLDVRLDLKLIEPHDPMEELTAGRADVAIVVFPADVQPPPGIQLTYLLEEPYVAILPTGHELAVQEVLDLSELADYPWVNSFCNSGICRDIVQDSCAAAGFFPNFVVEADDFATARGFVAAGLGVTILPRLGVGLGSSEIVVRKLRKPEPTRIIWAAIREESIGNQAIESLLTAFKQATA